MRFVIRDPKKASPGSASFPPERGGHLTRHVGVNPAQVTLYAVFSPSFVTRCPVP